MIRKSGGYTTELIKEMKGGVGEFQIEHILRLEELGKAGRLFAWGTLKSGHSVGKHIHEDNIEVCCFVSGKGVVREGDKEIPVEPGDVNYVPVGGEHEIINTGEIDLVYVVCVLYP